MKNQLQPADAPVTARLDTDSALRKAYAEVPAAQKTHAFTMLVLAGITVAVLLLSRLFWLFEPLLDRIDYGLVSELIYYLFLFILCIVFSVVLDNYLKKHLNERIYARREQKMTIPQALAIVALAAAAVFIANAALKFHTKIELEMGSGITMAATLTNFCVYFYYAFHMWLGFTAAVLVQRALMILIPTKHTVPWGAIFLVAVYGVLELLLESTATPHLYPWMYYLFTYVYAAIFVISDYRFHVPYWAAIIIMVF